MSAAGFPEIDAFAVVAHDSTAATAAATADSFEATLAR
jgi:hypothetical protein